VDAERAEETLAAKLRAMRIDAGWPVLRDIADRVADAGGRTSHTTVAHMFRSSPDQRLWPAWETIADVVTALGGHPSDVHALWGAMVEQRRSVPARAGDDTNDDDNDDLGRLAAAAERIAAVLERVFPTDAQPGPTDLPDRPGTLSAGPAGGEPAPSRERR
jgi:hypothetical protein